MKLYQIIADTVRELGEANIYKLHARHPGYSRSELLYALKSASREKLIKLLVRGRHGKPSTYGPGDAMPEARGPQSFAFSEAVKLPEWHLKHKGGRAYSPLGSWRD
jgi:hypothetical protein